MNQIDVLQEIKRRQKEAYKRSLYFIVPLVLDIIATGMNAPRLVVGIGFVAAIIGFIILMVYYYRVHRCPACNYSLNNLFEASRCPRCHTSFTSSA